MRWFNKNNSIEDVFKIVLRDNRIIDLGKFSIHFSMHNMDRAKRKISKILFNPSDQEKESFEIKRIKEAASILNIEFSYLGFGTYEFCYEGRTKRIREDLRTDDESCMALFLCGHKYLTFETLGRNDFKSLPFYKLYSFNTINDARNDFLKRNKSVVIKPCQGTSGGKGVTVDIRNLNDLNRAIYSALLYNGKYMMEDFVEGDHFRLLFFEGNFLSGVKRYPARVIGDGVKNLKNLVNCENRKRTSDTGMTALYPISSSFDMKHNLKSLNLKMSYVPREGEIVNLKKVVNLKAGGDVEDVSDMVSNEIIRECEKICKIMKVSLCGIDIISNDITTSDFIVNEVNTTPTIDVHYKVTNQEKRRDVAQDILKGLFKI